MEREGSTLRATTITGGEEEVPAKEPVITSKP
jgi:hypothetical protein